MTIRNFDEYKNRQVQAQLAKGILRNGKDFTIEEFVSFSNWAQDLEMDLLQYEKEQAVKLVANSSL